MSKTTLEKFYNAFKNHDAKKMAECYHKEVIFNDPAFQNLNYEEVAAMWAMLIERSKGKLEINFDSIVSDDHMAQCIWEADYEFSKTGNQVHNVIHATMEFKDGLIIKHTDHFDFWRWSKMALGLTGTLLGWSPILKNKVRKMAKSSLNKYMIEH
ncbi:nuclear transport factor 2 family protein [Ekhidna sp. To15]|uniref:nuclear transport factor 2 family protein n=1 Tax=Ekhidna sp. To15 TaxID=3395267 RepID=UPI003F51E0D0